MYRLSLCLGQFIACTVEVRVLMMIIRRFNADLMSSIPEILPEGERVVPQSVPSLSFSYLTNLCFNSYYPTLSSSSSRIPESTHPDRTHGFCSPVSCQFHAKLPLQAPYIGAPSTVGCFSTGKMIHEGRHEQIIEVWRFVPFLSFPLFFLSLWKIRN